MADLLTRRESFAAAVGCLLVSRWTESSLAEPLAASDGWIAPPALRRGDTVRLIAPASPVDMEKIRKAQRVFQKIGLRVDVPEDLGRSDGYLAGTDQQRIEELNTAIADPGIAAIFPCRGGYGLTRILDRIDYNLFRANPKILVGFSDITALHLAVARKARVITFHSAMPQYYLWDESEKFADSARTLWRMIMPTRASDTQQRGFVVESPASLPRPQRLAGGRAQGRLVGGNLTLISITLGTPYAIQPEGNLLILEDVDEPPQKVDRYFSQLRLAGVLDAVKGILVGSFTASGGELPKEQYRQDIKQIVRHYCGRLGIPVVTDFPIGHTPCNLAIPLGARAELDADRVRLAILENPVTVHNG
jgi:muramoyltetrapeptide carboxypeptidase